MTSETQKPPSLSQHSRWRRSLLPVALILCAAVACWHYLDANPSAPGESAPHDVEESSEEAPSPSAQRAAKGHAGQPAPAREPQAIRVGNPLPPLDLPLAETFAELEQRSQRGDHRAACRLGEELRRCHGVSPFGGGTAPLSDEQIAKLFADSGLAGESLERELQRTMTRRDEESKLYAHCAGVAASDSRRAPYFQLQAARAGHIDAVLAIANPRSLNLVADLMDDPGLAQLYHDHRLPMLIRALEAGHPRALEALFFWSNSTGSHSNPVDLLPEEWRIPDIGRELVRRISALTAERARQAGRNFRDPFSDVAGSDLSIEQAIKVDQLFDRYFARSPHLTGELERSEQGLPTYSSRDDRRDRCNDDLAN